MAVIPARSGSKGLPGKNIIDLCGKPLIAYTIAAALRCPYIDKVIVSTDGKSIAEVSRRYGAEVPFMRPGYLAQDNVHTPVVIEHAVKHMTKCGFDPELIVTLQPTSPLRCHKHIERALNIIVHQQRFDSVVSVKPVDFPPFWTVRVGKKMRLIPFVNDGTDYFKKERQQLPKTYQINGAIYVTRKSALFNEKAIITKRCGVLVMDAISSLDIDTREDLLKIRKMMMRKNQQEE